MAMTAEEMAKLRWKGVTKREREEFSRNASNARWEQWRADNPEKAAASEARRAKRTAKAAARPRPKKKA